MKKRKSSFYYKKSIWIFK